MANEFPPLVLDESLVKAAVEGVQSAFGALFALTPEVGPYTISQGYLSHGDVSGVLGMLQDRVEGTLVVSFQAATILSMMALMYGSPISEINDSVKQGVGELTNIIYAGIKKDLNSRGYKFKMSIPTVVLGVPFQGEKATENFTLAIPFKLPEGAFSVEIVLIGI